MFPHSHHRRRRRRRLPRFALLAAIVLICGSAWMFWPRDKTPIPNLAIATPMATAIAAEIPEAVLVEDARPVRSITPVWELEGATSSTNVTESLAGPVQDAENEFATVGPKLMTVELPDETAIEPYVAATQGNDEKNAGGASGPPASGNARVAAILERYKAGERIRARHELNGLLATSPTHNEAAEIRRHLTSIAEETVFSRKRLDDDPLSDTYTVRSGDKPISVARQFDVPHETLLLVNGLASAKQFREGETIKVLKGPFHAKVSMSEFRLDLYLQDLYVRSFRVGVGRDESTPDGVWMVKRRLQKPTYYPPASAEDKRVIYGDDPTNPLVAYWIGLEGVSGEAVGKKSYGIHGTIEPDTIGKNASAGCVRMLNEDVEFVFRTLREGKSTVTILP